MIDIFDDIVPIYAQEKSLELETRNRKKDQGVFFLDRVGHKQFMNPRNHPMSQTHGMERAGPPNTGAHLIIVLSANLAVFVEPFSFEDLGCRDAFLSRREGCVMQYTSYFRPRNELGVSLRRRIITHVCR